MASGMRLVVSCISSFLILSLLLFMVHRLRQRRRERIESLIGANCECPLRATALVPIPTPGHPCLLRELLSPGQRGQRQMEGPLVRFECRMLWGLCPHLWARNVLAKTLLTPPKPQGGQNSEAS